MPRVREDRHRTITSIGSPCATAGEPLRHPPSFGILALPALMMTFTRLAPLDLTLKSVLVIQAAMPAAIFPIVVAHHGDMPTALRVVLGTSAVGLITIPLWIGFGLHWILPGR
jgi:predicted permease